MLHCNLLSFSQLVCLFLFKSGTTIVPLLRVQHPQDYRWITWWQLLCSSFGADLIPAIPKTLLTKTVQCQIVDEGNIINKRELNKIQANWKILSCDSVTVQIISKACLRMCCVGDHVMKEKKMYGFCAFKCFQSIGWWPVQWWINSLCVKGVFFSLCSNRHLWHCAREGETPGKTFITFISYTCCTWYGVSRYIMDHSAHGQLSIMQYKIWVIQICARCLIHYKNW